MTTIDRILSYLKEYRGKPIQLMEVCGTHTYAIAKSGIKSMLSPDITLVSGPGCPVCVTAKGYMDRLVALATEENTVIASFGDLLKVPSSTYSLAEIKARGGNVRYFYSPFEVCEWALENPNLTYIIAAVGFETTAPIYTILLDKLLETNTKNVKLLTALKTMPPILSTLCEMENTIDGFIAPGHVSTIIGEIPYQNLCEKYHKPFAIGGFGQEEVLLAIYDLVRQIEKKSYAVHNLYPKAVKKEGNQKAQQQLEKYFRVGPAIWRGLGSVVDSGLYLKSIYSPFDADSKCMIEPKEKSDGCCCDEIIMGKKAPDECPLFGKVCTPSKPFGPCMVSSEGACGIYFRQGGTVG